MKLSKMTKREASEGQACVHWEETSNLPKHSGEVSQMQPVQQGWKGRVGGERDMKLGEMTRRVKECEGHSTDGAEICKKRRTRQKGI